MNIFVVTEQQTVYCTFEGVVGIYDDFHLAYIRAKEVFNEDSDFVCIREYERNSTNPVEQYMYDDKEDFD